MANVATGSTAEMRDPKAKLSTKLRGYTYTHVRRNVKVLDSNSWILYFNEQQNSPSLQDPEDKLHRQQPKPK